VTAPNAAEKLLIELGVSEPEDLDLDAIAWHAGVKVKYRCLDGCEARIVGHNDRAIVTVHDGLHERRRRFSVGHELGHWHYHRGRSFICRAEDIGSERQNTPPEEREADHYAADLLLPWFLLRPLVRQSKSPSFELTKQLGELFKTSLTATAIRLVDANTFPILLICHTKEGRKWFKRAKDVPERWFPKKELDSDSYAFDVLFGSRGDHKPVKMGADAWFDRYDAERYELLEQTVRISDAEVLTMLLLQEDEMLREQNVQARWR
jgi:hypothetical protein